VPSAMATANATAATAAARRCPFRSRCCISYPLQPTAECAVSPGAIVPRIRALLRHPGRSGSRTGGRPPPPRWPRRRG
jgi:hypothetical protein